MSVKTLLTALILGTALSAADSAAADSRTIDVYLIGGQSNATGQGYLRNLPAGSRPIPRSCCSTPARPISTAALNPAHGSRSGRRPNRPTASAPSSDSAIASASWTHRAGSP